MLGQLTDEHVFLVGRPPLSEYLSFVTSLADLGEEPDLRGLADEWRSAHDHVTQLEKQEKRWADSPKIGSPPSSLDHLVEQVSSDPIFQRSFEVVPAKIGIVDLDRLVIFQNNINLAYVRQIQESLGNDPTEETVFRICLPFDHPQPPMTQARIGNNEFVFVSPSTDFRFLEPTMLKPSQITNYRPQGPISQVLALVVGFGSNFLCAIHTEGRLVLNNGSHRAFALREMNIKHVPCLIQEISRRDELELVTSGDLCENPDRYLKTPRPPVLKDYFDPMLRKVLPVPRKLRQIKVTFEIELMNVPASS